MSLLRAKRVYDRSQILDSAARARARKQHKRAIALYRWVLAVEPQNAELHARLAPLLAEAGHYFDAWVSFRTTAEAALRDGLTDKALAIYREAASHLPHEYRVWQEIARLEKSLGRDRDAIEALLQGRRQLRNWRLRPQAVYLLRRARRIDPWDFEVCLDLARLLSRSDQIEEAQLLLHGLAERSAGDRLRRVRSALFWLEPGPGRAWRWLQTLLRRGAEGEELEPGRLDLARRGGD